MSVTDNRTLIQKADLAIADLTTDGGYLEDEQSMKFIKVAIEQSKLLTLCTVDSMRSPKKKLETFRFGSRILHIATSAQALPVGKRSKPDLTMAELSTHEFKAEIRLPYDVLEDNIERDGLESTVMQALPEACGRDMEEIALMSVTTSGDADLANFSGFLAAATTNTVNVASAAMSQDVLENMLLAMPNEFKATKPELRYFVSTNTEIRYRNLLAQTAREAGQVYHDEAKDIQYSGIPMVPLAKIAEPSSLTQALLVHPKNLHVGVQRQIRIETARDISAGVVIIVASVRMDAKYEYEPACVRAYDITV